MSGFGVGNGRNGRNKDDAPDEVLELMIKGSSLERLKEIYGILDNAGEFTGIREFFRGFEMKDLAERLMDETLRRYRPVMAKDLPPAENDAAERLCLRCWSESFRGGAGFDHD